MRDFPLLDEGGVKTLPIGIDGTQFGCLAFENKVQIRRFGL